jgi:hypothetical protein
LYFTQLPHQHGALRAGGHVSVRASAIEAQ